MSLTCKHCDCDNFREELMGNAMMVSNEGNCKNCQHPVNAHPRSSASQQPAPLVATANIVAAAVVTEADINMVESDMSKGKGNYTSSGTETFISPHNHNQLPQHPLPFIPLDNSGAHIPQYDPKQGGYVTGTGSIAHNECTQGDYNSQGMDSPGVNGTVKSTGSVAYGGVYNSQYEGDYYSAKRVQATEMPISSAPEAVKVVSSASTTATATATASVESSGGGAGEFDYAAVRGQYGSGYSAKR